jgi:hypothetical protein
VANSFLIFDALCSRRFLLQGLGLDWWSVRADRRSFDCGFAFAQDDTSFFSYFVSALLFSCLSFRRGLGRCNPDGKPQILRLRGCAALSGDTSDGEVEVY